MNHDYTHCLDYDETCPDTCFRVELAEDLKKHKDEYIKLPLSYSHLRETDLCEKNRKTDTTTWSYVFDELIKLPMFRMEYDAKNGNEHFMYGIATVMEYIAEKADREDEYTRIFNDGLNLSKSKVVTTCDQ